MKRLRVIAAVAILAGLLTGCGTMATTPNKLISQVKQMNDHDAIQKYEVNRSLAQVSATLKERSKKCLAVAVTVTYRQGYGYHTDTTYYTPHIRIGARHTRFTLQKGYGKGTIVVGDKPDKDGWYVMVVDAYSAGGHRTRLEGYSGFGDTVAFKAVRHWADGSNLGCPDMTK